MMPLGIQDTRYRQPRRVPAVTDINTCIDQNLTSGHLNIPGGFGWLKFGLNNGNKCDWVGASG